MYVYMYVKLVSAISRLTVVSHEAKKKQAICDKWVSYLHVRSTAQNSAGTVHK